MKKKLNKESCVLIPHDGIYLPHSEGMLLPMAEYAEVLGKLRKREDHFILIETDPVCYPTLSNAEVKKCTAVLCTVADRIVFPDGTARFVIVAESRVVLDDVVEHTTLDSSYNVKSFMFNAFYHVPDLEAGLDPELLRKMRVEVLRSFAEYCTMKDTISPEKAAIVRKESSLLVCCDLIACLLDPDLDTRRVYLAQTSANACAAQVMSMLEKVLFQKRMMDEIKLSARNSIDNNQKMYFLNEQLKALRQEMNKLRQQNRKTGVMTEGEDGEVVIEDMGGDEEDATLLQKAKDAGMPSAVFEKIKNEIKKLSMQPKMSPDSAVLRNYVETVINLPWNKTSVLNRDMVKAAKILDEDHYGLEKVKERIMEYLAVQSRADRLRAPIICLVGPPGVGKTSLGRSIAKATGREYVRAALGGMHDESEIRGHRRTYLGAMPGKIIKKLAKAGVRNPLFLLDEIDKIGTDSYHGDPSSALLEVLDPEQNNAFSDNYLDVDFDLSDVMFIATSNSMKIPPALADRMEIIKLSSYTEDEKMHILREHLIPKEFERNCVHKGEVEITDEACHMLIRNYTAEAGVRSLERLVARLCRKAVNKILQSNGEVKAVQFTPDNLPEYLGPVQVEHTSTQNGTRVGIVNGLAYTSVGGELLSVESVTMAGSGRCVCTGKLGEVMKESVQTAFSLVRARLDKLRIDEESFRKKDLHVHFPEGAVPKDGPSAGIAITTAIASAFTGNPVKNNVAMTGEITLSGEVLAIGGLKEKLYAAKSAGVKTVLIPKDNVKNLEEVPDSTKDALEIIPVEKIEDVLEHALVYPVDKVKLPRRKKQTASQTASKSDKLVQEMKDELTSVFLKSLAEAAQELAKLKTNSTASDDLNSEE